MIDVATERLRAQALVRPLGSAAAVVSHLLAVQAQDYGGARWAIGQRVRGASDVDVERAFDTGEILRTHVMRPTWHFVAPADIRWLLALTAPRIHSLGAYYYKQQGLTAKRLGAMTTAIAKALRGGVYLTRDELATRAGLGKTGTALAYVIMHAELEAVIVSGPRHGKQFTYALLDERVPSREGESSSTVRSRDDALAELARRYVESHGPAQTKDLAWWSGVTTADARRAFELANVARFEISGVEYWHEPPARRVSIANTHVRLLPNYDELLIAFADRSAARDPRTAKIDKAVIFHHFVVSNGRLIGGYRCTKNKRTVVLACTLLVAPTAAERAALEAEVARYGAFIAQPVRLDLTVPRSRRS